MKKMILIMAVAVLGIMLSFPHKGVSVDKGGIEPISFTMGQIIVMTDMIAKGGYTIAEVATAVGASQRDVFVFWNDMYLRGVRLKLNSSNPLPLPLPEEYRVRAS